MDLSWLSIKGAATENPCLFKHLPIEPISLGVPVSPWIKKHKFFPPGKKKLESGMPVIKRLSSLVEKIIIVFFLKLLEFLDYIA